MHKAIEVSVSDRQRSLLARWIRNKRGTSQRFYERCQMVLMGAEGLSNSEIGRRLAVDRQRCRRWRRRWVESEARLATAEREGASDKDLSGLLSRLLADVKRSGATPKFSAEQLTQIIALACELPEESGRPVTHWTPPELADEAVKRGIVGSISARHVDRLLKGGICVRIKASIG